MAKRSQMKKFLNALTAAASDRLSRPTEPQVLMRALCSIMSERLDRPVDLKIVAFPHASGASGLTINFEDGRALVLVEERTDSEHQLVILGHELWHLQHGHCGHAADGLIVAARALAADDELPWDKLFSMVARSPSHNTDEADADDFGLLLSVKFRHWLTGPYASGPVTQATVEGRIGACLNPRTGL
ncbi:toxin [Streptomyces sp. 11x1]|uniref:toxin n=1 Tax=Streptomyces sp. 11x1 TaxID=3038642 RepID=UPI00292CE221|nr:toxin [Streptomyces sp. 11x1]WNZ14880.1 toxin [Streptomyces sp. 11x1]